MGNKSVKQKKNYYYAQEICSIFGFSKKTLFLWEDKGLISRPLRDWRGWRRYSKRHLQQIKKVMAKKGRAHI